MSRGRSLRVLLLPAGMVWAACGSPKPSGGASTDPPDGPQDTGVDTLVGDTVTIEVEPGLACEELGTPGTFSDVDPGPDWAGQPQGGDADRGGWGVAVADFDGDGDLDIFLPHWGPDQLFLNQGGMVFTDASEGLPDGLDGDTLAVLAADLDGDFDIDLVLGNHGVDRVLLNHGDGTFSLVEGDDPLWGDGDQWRTMHLAAADFDGDQILDIFAATGWQDDSDIPDDNGLFRGLGDGRFQDLTATLPDQDVLSLANAAGWIDANEDGISDLYIVNDKPQAGFTCRLLLGDGLGGLVDPGSGHGLDVAISGMGLAEGDLNGDGHTDYVVTGWDEIALLVADGAGGWYDAALAWDLAPVDTRIVAWGPDLADLDHDGDLDLLVAYGPDYDDQGNLGGGTRENLELQDWGLYRNDGGHFVQVAESSGLTVAGNRRGFVLADLDGDGHLDLVARDLADQASIYRGACTDRSWLVVIPRQQGSPNTHAIGAKVEITAGDLHLVRSVRLGVPAVSSSAPARVHFGLGEADRLDQLRITWPDGAVSELGPVDVDTVVTVTRDLSAED